MISFVSASPSVLFEGYRAPSSNQIVVGDAETKEIIASYLFPDSLRATVHTSLMSPDGRYAYIVGPRLGEVDGYENYSPAATLIKVDALTLQPIRALDIGGRIHHGQVFGDVMLLDMFGRGPGGLARATDKRPVDAGRAPRAGSTPMPCVPSCRH